MVDLDDIGDAENERDLIKERLKQYEKLLANTKKAGEEINEKKLEIDKDCHALRMLIQEFSSLLEDFERLKKDKKD